MALTKKKPLDAASTPQEKRPAHTSRDCVLTDEIALRWAKMPSWSLQEAIYLARNRDPDCAAEIIRSSNQRTVKVGKASATVKRGLYDFVRRAHKGGDLPEDVTPAHFIEWAQSADVKLPNVLVTAVMRVHPRVKNWKAEFDRSQSELAKQNKNNVLLKSENEHLKRIHQEDQLGTKEKASVYKILAGIAYRYGHRTDNNSKATSLMCAAVDAIGLKIHEDTVRRKIKESFEMYRDTINKVIKDDSK